MSDLDELGRSLAALFPVASNHRGWTVSNLRHNWERTEWGVEESWACDIIGPRDLLTERMRFIGHDSTYTWRLYPSAIGSAESTTAEGLVEQVAAIVESLGLADLKEPA